MDYYFMSDPEICRELGQRLRKLRLRKNWTQKEISQFTGLSLNTIKAIEKGEGKLKNIIKFLRALKSLDHLDSFIPEPGISPRLLYKLKGKTRIRATGDKKKGNLNND